MLKPEFWISLSLFGPFPLIVYEYYFSRLSNSRGFLVSDCLLFCYSILQICILLLSFVMNLQISEQNQVNQPLHSVVFVNFNSLFCSFWPLSLTDKHRGSSVRIYSRQPSQAFL